MKNKKNRILDLTNNSRELLISHLFYLLRTYFPVEMHDENVTMS